MSHWCNESYNEGDAIPKLKAYIPHTLANIPTNYIALASNTEHSLLISTRHGYKHGFKFPEKQDKYAWHIKAYEDETAVDYGLAWLEVPAKRFTRTWIDGITYTPGSYNAFLVHI